MGYRLTAEDIANVNAVLNQVQGMLTHKAYAGPRRGRKGQVGGSMPRAAGASSDAFQGHLENIARQNRKLSDMGRMILGAGNVGMGGKDDLLRRYRQSKKPKRAHVQYIPFPPKKKDE